MIITIDLHQNIYDQLVIEAESIGLSVEEHIRGILGSHASFFRPKPSLAAPIMSVSMPPDIIDKANRMINLVIRQMLTSGDLKCPVCTLTIIPQALEKGECNNCGTKL